MPLARLLYALTFVSVAAPLPTLYADGQTVAKTAAASGSMTNSDVVTLVGAGLLDDIVIAKIQAASSTAFDTSVTGLSALKQANVPGPVIRAMINPHPPAAAAGPYAIPAATPASDPDDPNAAHSAGLYTLTQAADGQPHMRKMESESPRGAKNSGMFTHVITHGITAAKTQECSMAQRPRSNSTRPALSSMPTSPMPATPLSEASRSATSC